MVLTLYGFAGSTYAQRVLLLLKETRTQYEWRTVDVFAGAHTTPEFLAKHPFGQVPYLDDDGFVLFESRAICKYIAAEIGGTPLVPTSDVRRVARFEQALSMEHAHFDAHARPIARERIVNPWFGRATDEGVVREAAQALQDSLVVYETILAQQKYLAGDEVTMADLDHLPYGSLLVSLGFVWLEDAEALPNVARWWADISSRSSWLEIKAGDVERSGA